MRVASILKIPIAIVLCIACWATSGTTEAMVENHRGNCYSIGPDVVAKFWDVQNYGSVGDIAAFSFGTDACNIGDEVLNWIGDTPDHPVISSAIYRLKNGRFEQVGLSWGKHGFSAAQSPDRCDCECIPSNDNQYLGVGCADAYGAGTNGLQGLQGPRSEVNAFMGDFPFPPMGWGEGGNIIFKRLQAHHLDLEPSVSGGAEYFGEIQFISPHDSLFGNQFNNSTWQPISISGSGSNWTIALSGQDHVGEPALRAWGEQNSSVRITESRPINDGAILVGVLASPVVDGWYQYEYAIQNVNADRGVQQLEIQLPLGGKVLEMGFHGVAYHSDELVDDTEWSITNDSTRLIWQTNTFEENPMSNAIRWGTTYNFRFISNVPPADGIIKLKPFHLNGVIKNEFINTRVPNLNIDPCGLAESQCPTDLTSDGAIDVADLLLLFDWWGDCGDGTYKPLGDANGDCCVNVQDMLAVIEDWGEECSNGEEGACCLEDGSCISSDSQADCELKAGIWNGLFTTCKTVSCANVGACCLNDGQCQPNTTIAECVNMNGGWFGIDSICTDITCGVGSDNCSDAPWVNAGLHFINTTMATTDGPNHTECETGGDAGATGNDIWMQYQAETNGTLTVSTCEQVGGSADFDTDIVVYDGNDCNNLTILDCDDDTPDFKCGSESGGYHSNVVVPVIQGTAYLIRVGGWQDGHYGTGSLLIEEK